MTIDQTINPMSTNETIWILRTLVDQQQQHRKQVNDSSSNSISRKTKSHGPDHHYHQQDVKSDQTIKSLPYISTDFSDMEHNNTYADTPPKIKATTLINGTNHYMPILQQRRPLVPTRSDSSRSVGSTTISSLSSQSTTPSNSYRQNPTNTMSRSVDAPASCGLMAQINNNTSDIKSKSTYDIETAILFNNSKCLNMITNGNFVPLESVKEDEYLEVVGNNKKYLKNDNEKPHALIETLKQTYSSSRMPRNHSSHQRSSSSNPTDDELSPENMNGFNRNHRIRSSLPFIMKPAVNSTKSNSLGLCFLICGNETRKVLLPPYISCLDTLKALFVRAFPQHLTMKQMDTEQIRIYIRESEKDIFYQLEDMNDVKDRAVLKLIQLTNPQKPHVSFKEPEIEKPTINDEITYQRLSRLSRITPLTNGHTEESSADNSPRSISEPRRERTPTKIKSILLSPKNDSTTALRNDEDDARTKMMLMEQQLESLTELVQQLTYANKSSNAKSLYEQFDDLKMKTHAMRSDLIAIRRMQQSLQENFQTELEQANRKIGEQFTRISQNESHRQIEKELNLYLKNRTQIDQDLEDLETSVEQLQNDVKSKQCYVTINDIEGFAFVLSTISRSLVDIKTSFPVLRDKLSSVNHQIPSKFLQEEPERLDFTIKKCKRLTTMLYQLKRLTNNQDQRSPRKVLFRIDEKSINRNNLLNEIQSVTLNSEERLKAIERAEKLRKCRLYYEHQLETLKQIKPTSDQIDGYSDSRSLTNSLSTRASVCSTDSNNCPSPSPSYIIRQALITPSLSNDVKSRLMPTSLKVPSKVTFSQQLITNEKCLSTNKKAKPNPPARIQSTPSSSSAVSSASSSSSSSCTGSSSRFCGIIPLLSIDRRHNGRCYSFSSSSTDTDSVISTSQKPATVISSKFSPTTLMHASVTDL